MKFMNQLKNRAFLVQRSTFKLVLLLLLSCYLTSGCGQGKGLFGKKNDCGCPNKKGMVGY